MPSSYKTKNGTLIQTGKELGKGGEGVVSDVDAKTVAKIYKKAVDNRSPRGKLTEQKLTAMVENPAPTLDADGNVALTWPKDLLYYYGGPSDGQLAGFTMPKIDLSDYGTILNFWHPQLRKRNANIPDAGDRLEELLEAIVKNTLTIVSSIHKLNYVIGDINESNILVRWTGPIVILDTDSFQVPDQKNRLTHRCRVGKLEFLDPRVVALTRQTCPNRQCPAEKKPGHKKEFACFDRTVNDDNFAIAVVLFKLLMLGTHPFDGLDRPEVALPDKILARQFPYNNPRLRPPGRTQERWNQLSDEWQKYFVETFTTDTRYTAEALLKFGAPLKGQQNMGQQITVSWASPAQNSTMMKCLKCGRDNAAPAIFCRFDGCEAWLTGKGKQCVDCSQQIPFNAVHCPECGQRQHQGRTKDEVLMMT